MISWKIWDKSAEEWDKEILKFCHYNVYQVHSWCEVKSKQGWKIFRLFLEQNGKCVAMVQMQVKYLPLGFALIWIPGGPVGDIIYYDNNFLAQIRPILSIKFFFLRMNIMRKFDESNKETLLLHGWKYAFKPILSSASVLINTTSEQKEWLAEIKGKHRYYVKKALKEDVIWVFGQELKLLEDLNTMVQVMKRNKGLFIPQIPITLFNLILHKNIRVLIGYLNGKPVAGCLVLIVGTKVNYLTAANVDEGRDLNAGYSMIYTLREKMIEEGITDFDFGGINPANESVKGVDHFKLGFGNRIDYLGEIEYSRPSVLRYPLNYFIKLKYS